ncbi:hypothetical protein [Amycolatopsis ultiminotia]|uniref:hypothetical protein n=1 Tax=Amycolatopsis ultiminotia TaxID=543629 RepID=UPI0031E968AE
MTSIVKHSTRKPLPAVTSVAAEQRLRNGRLRTEFPPRSAEEWWPHAAATAEQVQQRLTAAPFAAAANGTQAARRREVAKLLRWLLSFPGDTWQDHRLAGGAEERPGAGWIELPMQWFAAHGGVVSYDSTDLPSGLLMLICGDVIRPGLPWMLPRTHRYPASVMAQVRDPAGFARPAELAAAEPASSPVDAKIAATRIATILAGKSGAIADTTVGGCVELVETMRRVHTRGGHKKLGFYLRLRALGVFPGDAPHRIRASGLAGGRLTIEQLVDRYRIQCRPIRDLLVNYLQERQPSLDFTQPGRRLADTGRAVLGSRRGPRSRHRHPPASAPARGRPRLEGRADARPSALSGHRTLGRRGRRPLGAVGRALPDQRHGGPESHGTQASQGPHGPAHPRAATCPARAGAHHQ